jgi:hypothetical protein
MVFNVNNIKTIPKATVTKNPIVTPQGQADLDYSEKTITDQHSPINNGQGNSTDIRNWTNKTAEHHSFGNQTQPNSNLDLAFLGANNTSPKNDLDMILMGADYKVEINKDRNFTQENTPPPVRVPEPTTSMVGGNRLSQDEYQAILAQQKQNKTKNFEPTPLSFPKAEKLELNAKDFFKGTKSGNEVFNPVDVFKNDGTKDIKKVKGYADVDPFGDFSETNPFSNDQANSKALKKQFDFYKNISNF